MSVLPVYFLSHGSPDLLVRGAPASQFMKNLSLPLDEARAIVIISAHWETKEITITSSKEPETIHDFYGFHKELYNIKYPVKGDPELAQDIAELLKSNAINANLDYKRGLDHGAWIPLILIAPKLNIPVIQVSIQPNETAQHHYKIGEILSSLREMGIIIIGSGNITHNIRAALHGSTNEDINYTKQFDDWIHNSIIKNDYELLFKWHEKAPYAKWNHPTDDHILPLFSALGASKGGFAQRIHHSYDYNVLSMGAYIFTMQKHT